MGVDVLAAADGRTQSLCDEIADQILSSETLTKNKGKECGNGIMFALVDS